MEDTEKTRNLPEMFKATSGRIPIVSGGFFTQNCGFSIVLGLDGQRIITFGSFIDLTEYVLFVTNFNWYIPNISGKIPTPRKWHQANICNYDKSVESDILLLDISNNDEYVWTTTFDPSASNNTVTTSSLPTSSSSLPLQSSIKSNNNQILLHQQL
ncbi:hypothetical protein C1645_877781 [Glomus cerebriforme]|uniref:Uncharacterized protein n=1 Tax=Glomus cerebriforme TaxID=658196 RepID=A0A397SPA1_9GLOM|nr:hypothetical protein C1645_877781 [Glomus cerebriforme]